MYSNENIIIAMSKIKYFVSLPCFKELFLWIFGHGK